MRIGRYIPSPATFVTHDPAAAEVATFVRNAIRANASELQVEHVGSTSVPGCGGKGIVDLAVLYPEDCLERARAVLDAMGFQKQGGPDPFPESRPMRVGCVEFNGRVYRIHAHVIARGSDEERELLWFRDALRGNTELRLRYEEKKRAILASGITDSIEYCEAKGEFIVDALKSRVPSDGRNEPA